MNATEKARTLGTEHGTRAAEDYWPKGSDWWLGFGAQDMEHWLKHPPADHPLPTLSGLAVVTELELPVAAGDFDQLYGIRQSYEAAFTAAVERTIRAKISGAPVCEWFAMCANPAVGTVAHPIMGEVPTCQRCTRWSGGHSQGA